MTLVETTVVASVLAIVISLAVPSFDGAIQRRHLEGAADPLETDIHYTRTLAVARNAALCISFESGANRQQLRDPHRIGQPVQLRGRWRRRCVPGRGAGRTCRALPGRRPGEPEVDSRSVLFDPVRIKSTPTATMHITARNGTAIHQVMNIARRVRSCSPAPAVSGYRRVLKSTEQFRGGPGRENRRPAARRG